MFAQRWWGGRGSSLVGLRTLAPIDRTLVDPTLLDESERAWLDAYHARVRETLTPLLNADAAEWLRGATAPIGTD